MAEALTQSHRLWAFLWISPARHSELLASDLTVPVFNYKSEMRDIYKFIYKVPLRL